MIHKKYLKKFFYTLISFFIFCSCTSKNDYTNVRLTLNKVFFEDQAFRKDDYNMLKQHSLDLKNIKIVTHIIDSLGWLSKEQVGDTASSALFLVIQHSNLKTMEKYLPSLKEAANNNKAGKQDLALLVDRVELLNYRPQIYGSQFIENNGKLELYKLIDKANVNTRRNEVGLEPIENYFKKSKK